jgi:hypothetical protein
MELSEIASGTFSSNNLSGCIWSLFDSGQLGSVAQS